MTNPTQINSRIQTAGAVTIIFGVLTAIMQAASVAILAIVRDSNDMPSGSQVSLTLLVATGFVLLGWGVLRRIRLCAALAGALAAAPLTLQLVATCTNNTQDASVFYLVLPTIVLGANWLAWRELGRLSLAEQPAEPAPLPLNEEA